MLDLPLEVAARCGGSTSAALQAQVPNARQDAVLLYKVRIALIGRTPTALSRATAFLHRDYKPEYFYWEIIELGRRTVLTGWVALIPETKAFLRLMVGMLVSLCVLVLVLTFSWVEFYNSSLKHFNPRSRYYVYHDLEAFAHPLALNYSSASGEPEEFHDMLTMYHDAQGIAKFFTRYAGYNTASLLLMAMRLLKVRKEDGVHSVSERGPARTCHP